MPTILWRGRTSPSRSSWSRSAKGGASTSWALSSAAKAGDDMLVQTNGVRLNAEVEGREGAPWLTFSNSLATDLTMWDAQVAALKDRYRILRYDKRGHGK